MRWGPVTARHFSKAAAIGILVTGLAFFTAAGGFLLAYRRVIRSTLDSNISRRSEGGHIVWMLWFLPPVKREVVLFTLRTLWRSRMHRTVLGAWVAAGVAFSSYAAIELLARQGPRNLGEPSVGLLSIPLTLQFFLISGLRSVLKLPVSLRANWLFRLNTGEAYLELPGAGRTSVVIVGVAPVAALNLLGGTYLWGPENAAVHTAFSILIGSLFVEALYWSYCGVPFASAYVPGKVSVPFQWVMFWVVFTTYTWPAAAWEQRLLRSGQAIPSLILLGLLLTVAIVVRRILSSARSLDYGEILPAEVQTLDLNG